MRLLWDPYRSAWRLERNEVPRTAPARRSLPLSRKTLTGMLGNEPFGSRLEAGLRVSASNLCRSSGEIPECRAEFVLEGGSRIGVQATGTWCAPYEPFHRGGLNEMIVSTDDGRQGTAVYEVTGAHHHHFFPATRVDNLPG